MDLHFSEVSLDVIFDTYIAGTSDPSQEKYELFYYDVGFSEADQEWKLYPKLVCPLLLIITRLY